MKRLLNKDKITFFQDSILKWYDVNGRKFPWRKSRLSNYKIIISEVLLQRTKAETVSKFYESFIKLFPTWRTLASASISKIENSLKNIGLQKQRASRLKKLSVIMADRNGRLPKTYEDLIELPFFGQYLANAIMLQVYKQPYPLLDVNMSRVLERFFGKRKLADIRYDPYLQSLANIVVSHSKSRHMNWGILDFSARECLPKKPKCGSCILYDQCKYELKDWNA